MGLREANQRFSKAVKAVKAGEEVVLTDRGQPIAVIKPLRAGRREADAIRRMVATGLLRPATRLGPMPSFRARSIRGRAISETVSEERAGR
ncbi:MAG: type II toxin-antitoxin system prevent-host-death family antitoxin [Candidatus Rokubacteria bacterium]|nr:type II toxin-antitoxin system prevent-host-death family antitoxin [Candidatus Rokubacteria bacterium]